MGLQLLKFPIISRCYAFPGFSLNKTRPFFFFISSSAPHLSNSRRQIYKHLAVRSFAANKSGKMEVKKKKRRLDEICLERFQQYSRTYIQSWILQGKVFVDGKVVNKAGTPVSDAAVVEIIAEIPKYVCRAGHKLEAAIEQLNVDVAGKVALDSGLSTGGFTDCLLQYGAAFVYGVDVGYGQVAEKIRTDKRVSVVERTNLRFLPGLPQKVDLVTLDLSFISILKVMPAVVNVMKEDATLVTLVKPQFEARRSQVGKGGIVRDPLVHQEVREMIINGIGNFGFKCKGWIVSPIKGAEGNTEFLVCFIRAADKMLNPPLLDAKKIDSDSVSGSDSEEENMMKPIGGKILQQSSITFQYQ